MYIIVNISHYFLHEKCRFLRRFDRFSISKHAFLIQIITAFTPVLSFIHTVLFYPCKKPENLNTTDSFQTLQCGECGKYTIF